MNNLSFYLGVQAELQKRAASTEVQAAGPVKPAPEANTAATPATPAKAPNNAVASGGYAGVGPSTTAQHTYDAAQARITAQGVAQPNQPQRPFIPKSNEISWEAIKAKTYDDFHSDKSMMADMDQRFVNASKPGAKPEIDDTMRHLLAINPNLRAHFDQQLGQFGAKRISDANILDGTKGFEPANDVEKELKAYGLQNPAVRTPWAKSVEDKTYGVGTLDDKGEFGMSKDLGKSFQGANFLKDHWGKLLMGLLGIGAMGWMGNQGQENQQPIVINNNQYGGPQAVQPHSFSGYAG